MPRGPFSPPIEGREAIRDAWDYATRGQQSDIQFGYEVLTVADGRGIARWWASMKVNATAQPVRMEGIFLVTLASDGLCQVFREVGATRIHQLPVLTAIPVNSLGTRSSSDSLPADGVSLDSGLPSSSNAWPRAPVHLHSGEIEMKKFIFWYSWPRSLLRFARWMLAFPSLSDSPASRSNQSRLGHGASAGASATCNTLHPRPPQPFSPIYLHVPIAHTREWHRYCGRYDACGRQVYFVQDEWYEREYVPRYKAHPEKFTMTAMKGKPIGAAVATMITAAVAATGRGMINSV